MTTSTGFVHSKRTQFIHSASAILIIGLFVNGNVMIQLEDISLQTIAYRLHTFTGLVLVLLTLARIYLRIKSHHPIPDGIESWNKTLYSAIHWLIYVNILLIGMSGATTMLLNEVNFITIDPSNLNRKVPSVEVHEIMGKLIFGLIFLHIAGVIRYQITKGDVLGRMGISIPFLKK
ncbi:MAG: cytochrome b/b6 domain-containing protein [Leptospiraceae bacterium]|nr:cytochrome b/b6 domain-containing protein [Leptospiraceae bacterium]